MYILTRYIPTYKVITNKTQIKSKLTINKKNRMLDQIYDEKNIKEILQQYFLKFHMMLS